MCVYRLAEVKGFSKIEKSRSSSSQAREESFQARIQFCHCSAEVVPMTCKQTSNGPVPVKPYLWTVKFEFQVIFICHEIILVFFNHFNELTVHTKQWWVLADLACGLQFAAPGPS